MAKDPAPVDGDSASGPQPDGPKSGQSASLTLYLFETLLPLLVVCGLAVFAALHFIRPAPPSTLTIASGPPGSRFGKAALQYQKILARNGIKLKVLSTAGSFDNLHRLQDAHAHVDIALVQTGTLGNGNGNGNSNGNGDGDDLVSLGSVFYEPLYIFYSAAKPMERLSELRGRRIAIGPEGSGTRSLALALLKANELTANGQAQLLDLEGDAAHTALLQQAADAIFLAGDSATNETIRELMHAPGVRLFDFPQADAYVRRFHYLSKLDLPAGSFDLGDNIPATRISLIAPTVELLAHEDLHPALSDLLIEAAIEVHGRASLMQSAGQFPSPLLHDFPISDDAARYYKSGKSFLYRYLPFWLASLLNRTVVALVPVLLVAIPALRYLPAAYSWRIRRRINRRYGQLMALERESLKQLSAAQRVVLVDRLAEIEKGVIGLKIPGSHADQLYVLRAHMKFVRENLARTAPRAAEALPDTSPHVQSSHGGAV